MTSLRSELLRKLLHIAMGGFAFLLRWLTPWQAAASAVAALGFNLFLLDRLTGRSLLRDAERRRGFSWGIRLYPAVVLIVILVFHRQLELAAATWALLAFGDGMAAVWGLLLRGPRLPWNREKSWAGFAGFVLYGSVGAAILLRWTQLAVLDAAGAEPSAAVTWIGGAFLDGVDGGVALLSQPLWLLSACLVCAAITALAESLDTGLDDNLVVPLVGGATLWAATLVEPARLLAAAPQLGSDLRAGLAINLVLAVLAWFMRGVTIPGAICGTLLGTALYAFAGWRGFLMLLTFFVLGTLCTRIGYAKKAALGIAQERGGRRGPANALANTTTGVLFAFLAAATPYGAACSVALAAAFATAAADTVSSEIGQAYGRRTYLVTNFRRVEPGTDGAVSLEGTLAGILAGAAVALVAWAGGLVSPTGAGIVAVAAFAGSTLESYLGATVEGLRGIDNDLVNFTNTLAGALIALALV